MLSWATSRTSVAQGRHSRRSLRHQLRLTISWISSHRGHSPTFLVVYIHQEHTAPGCGSHFTVQVMPDGLQVSQLSASGTLVDEPRNL